MTAPVTIVIPWPRVPTITPGGKPSRARNAGHLIPWLSANVVNNLPKPVYRSHKIRWREGTLITYLPDWNGRPLTGSLVADVTLYKATAAGMDSCAVFEGCKPIIDGLEFLGLLVNDRQITGIFGKAVKAESRDRCRVEFTLRAVA
ncbi:MAG: hypothetical protein NVS1B16_05590 [Pseudarthrobacter sp.]